MEYNEIAKKEVLEALKQQDSNLPLKVYEAIVALFDENPEFSENNLTINIYHKEDIDSLYNDINIDNNIIIVHDKDKHITNTTLAYTNKYTYYGNISVNYKENIKTIISENNINKENILSTLDQNITLLENKNDYSIVLLEIHTLSNNDYDVKYEIYIYLPI